MTLALLEGVILFLVIGARLQNGEAALESAGSLVAVQALGLTLCALFSFFLFDLYDLRQVRGFSHFVRRLPGALLLTFVLGSVVQALVPGFHGPMREFAQTVALAGMLVLPLRAAIHHLVSAHPFSRRILIIGTTELAGKLVREVLAEPDLRDVVVGVVDDGSGEFKPSLPALQLGASDHLGRIIDGFEPDLIVCAARAEDEAGLMRELLKPRARPIPVEDGVAAYERLTGKIAIEYATPRAILFSREAEPSWPALVLGRALSFVVASVGLLLLIPLLVPVGLLIKLDSEGPIFFFHERVGLGGRSFRLMKFRTMRTGGATSEWAADNTHRTTRVGKWLRRFRIDELPQFLNILKGDMNLVGPRPHPVSNVDLFTEHIPYYGVRCSVRPGVTGWAQIRYGYANNLEEETEKMRYDLHYIRNLSIALDLRILFETIKVVISGSKSAALDPKAGPRVLPIYFGDERSQVKDHVRPALTFGSRPIARLPGSADVISIDKSGARGSRRSSRDVA